MDRNNVIPSVVCGTRVGHTVALCVLKQSFCDLIWGKKREANPRSNPAGISASAASTERDTRLLKDKGTKPVGGCLKMLEEG